VHTLSLTRYDEILDLHLLKLASSKDKIAWCYFITERLSDLRDPERKFSARRIQHVREIGKNALCGLWA
jgi:hypothetical protein